MHANTEPQSPRPTAPVPRRQARGLAPAAIVCAIMAISCIAWTMLGRSTPRQGSARAALIAAHAPVGSAIGTDPSSMPESHRQAAFQDDVRPTSIGDATKKERYEGLAEPQPIDADRPSHLPGWEQHSCAKCHVEAAREWASSTHAMAWIDPRYQEALADMKRPEACHNCHIPTPLHAHADAGKPPQKPTTRALTTSDTGEPRSDADIHYGIACATCHEGKDGAILGPRGGPTDAHPTRKDDSFTDEGADRLCISCHATSVGPVVGIAKDFVDSRQRESHGLSCVGCHMQPLERPSAAEDGKAAYPSRATRSHALQTPRDPAFAARAFAIVVEPMGADGTLVALRNTTGHRVPGLVGREFLVAAVLRDGEGKELAREELVIDRSSAIPADGAAHLELPAKAAARDVVVVLQHLGPGMDDPIEIKRQTTRLP